MNRDERHERSEELPPQYLDATHQITAPIDPESGGTWIGMSKSGYAVCLLNGYHASDESRDRITQSRGVIIEKILSADAPFAAAATFDATDYASFRLLVCNADEHALYLWDGENYAPTSFHATHQDSAFFITSSSLDETDVIAARSALFAEHVAHYSASTDSIPPLHYMRLPNAEYAPLMYRNYSRTKSITSIALLRNKAPVMHYYPIARSVAEFYDAMPDNAKAA